jgi:hypothetical protein
MSNLSFNCDRLSTSRFKIFSSFQKVNRSPQGNSGLRPVMLPDLRNADFKMIAFGLCYSPPPNGSLDRRKRPIELRQRLIPATLRAKSRGSDPIDSSGEGRNLSQ